MNRLLTQVALVFLACAVLPATSHGVGVGLKVDPDFRTNAQWFWRESDGKCVPVPTYEIVSRIAPRKIRDGQMAKTSRCEIKLSDLQLKARLICNGRELQTYFAKEDLCKNAPNPVAIENSGQTHR